MVMVGKKVVVTGGAGFIGSHLVKRLVRDGNEVIVVDNLSESSLDKLEPIIEHVDFRKSDIRDLDGLVKIFSGVDTVFHLAALRSVKRSVDNPVATNDNNISGTLNVFEAARINNVRRVVSASSSSVYGKTSSKVLKETQRPNPQSPYALTKLAGEIYAKQFFDLYGMDIVSLRYFNVFGPGQDPKGEYAVVVPLFIDRLMNSKPPRIDWDGKQSRDFTHVDNVVEANLLAAKKSGVGGEVFNIAAGNSYSVNYLFDKISKLLGVEIKALKGPKRAGDVRYTCGSVEKAKEKLGFKIVLDFEKGLKKTVAWYRKALKKPSK